jgi:hypothetical protein
LAAGCSTSRSWRIVAPSLVIVTSPTSSTNILSRPTGPRIVNKINTKKTCFWATICIFNSDLVWPIQLMLLKVKNSCSECREFLTFYDFFNTNNLSSPVLTNCEFQ